MCLFVNAKEIQKIISLLSYSTANLLKRLNGAVMSSFFAKFNAYSQLISQKKIFQVFPMDLS